MPRPNFRRLLHRCSRHDSVVDVSAIEGSAVEPHARIDFDYLDSIKKLQSAVAFKVMDWANLNSPSNKGFDDWNTKFKSITHTQGSFNRIFNVQVESYGEIQDYVIKIPAHSRSWTYNDTQMMRSEAELLRYLRQNTTIPVPEVVEYNPFTDSDLQCEGKAPPYMMMKKLPGTSAEHIWFQRGENGELPTEVDERHLNADYPSEETVQKRTTFLKSLAGYMAQLQNVTFDKAGLPNFEDDAYTPTFKKVGRSYHWADKIGRYHKGTWRGAAVSSEEYFSKSGLDKMTYMEDEHEPVRAGVRKIMDIILSTPVFASSKAHPDDEEETFVLRHDDLELWNILTDEEGNVTGIVDWDRCLTVPRCVGAASMPVFLGKNWLTSFSAAQSPHMSLALPKYQQIYADAMQSQCSDGRLTTKSVIYQAVMGILHEGHCPTEFVKKLLKQFPELQIEEDVYFFLGLFGSGWPAAESRLTEAILKLLEVPEVDTSAVFEIGGATHLSDVSVEDSDEEEEEEVEQVEKETEPACTEIPKMKGKKRQKSRKLLRKVAHGLHPMRWMFIPGTASPCMIV